MPRRLLSKAIAKTATKVKQVAVFVAFTWSKLRREVRGIKPPEQRS